jgi:PilZ domain
MQTSTRTQTTAAAMVAETETETEAQPAFVERRRDPRYQFTATVELVDMTSRARVQARVSDLSRGGCYVDTTSPFPVATSVKMRLSVDDRCFEVQAKVVYSLPGMGMGMAFVATAPEQLEVLKRWIGELSGELPPELSRSDRGQTCKTHGAGRDPSWVLAALLMELVRQGVLPDDKGKLMLSQLLGN